MQFNRDGSACDADQGHSGLYLAGVVWFSDAAGKSSKTGTHFGPLQSGTTQVGKVICVQTTSWDNYG